MRRFRELYVDKTPWLRTLLRVSRSHPSEANPPKLVDKCQLLARPRRFGKSLLISLLETWFQGLPPGHAHAGTPQDGWLGAEGWSNPEWLWDGLDGAQWHGTHGWHPAIRLDFGGIDASRPDDLARELQGRLRICAGLWRNYGATWNAGQEPDSMPSPSTSLQALVQGLHFHYGSIQPVLLIDEYDAPLSSLIAAGEDPGPCLRVMRSFYGAIKSLDPLLYCVFMTGVTRLNHAEVFSGLNNVQDASQFPRLSGICGITESELDRDFAPFVARLQESFDERDVRQDLLAFYNGYRFAADAEPVINPFALLTGVSRVMDELPESGTAAQLAAQGAWPTLWSSSGPSSLIYRMMAQKHRGALPEEGQLPTSSVLDVRRPELNLLMLLTGYFTLSADRPPRLVFPNREVRETFLADWLAWEWQAAVPPERGEAMRKALLSGDVDAFMEHLSGVFAGVPYDRRGDREVCCTVLQTVLEMLGDQVSAERHGRRGRSDIECTPGVCHWIFEVKSGRERLQAGLHQARQRGYAAAQQGLDRDVFLVVLKAGSDYAADPDAGEFRLRYVWETMQRRA